ncbi:MAG: hypothetical protein ACM3MG_13570 [Bacillota bacterium]
MILAMTALLASFSTPAFADLKISANTSVWAMPAEAKSCIAWKSGKEENDIKSKYINLGNLGFEWDDVRRSLHITEIRVSLRGEVLKGEAYDCHITGAELQALGDKNWMDIPKASASRSSQRDTDCSLICGGIEFRQDIAVTMNGKIEVIGEAKSAAGSEPVIFALPITADNVEF